MIRCQNGEFILEDNNSKFGTLVAMKRPRMVEPGNAISIQMGRTVLSLSEQPGIVPDGNASLLQAAGGSSAQDERALRLSLFTRSQETNNHATAGGSADC